MRFRKKVSLILVLSTLTQIKYVAGSFVDISAQSHSNRLKNTDNVNAVTHPPVAITLRPQIQGTKVRTKSAPNKNDETIRKTFYFPEVEYPTASTPRPPYYLQKTNNLQKNPVQRATESPTSTTVKYPKSSNKKDKNKLKYISKPAPLKSTKKPDFTATYSGFGATPKPYCFREEGDFPDVEYPLDAKDTWNPNYWKPIPGGRFKNEINEKKKPENNSKFNPKVTAGIGTSSQVSTTSSRKSNASKNDRNSLRQVPSLQSSNNIQLNENYQQVTNKEKPGKNNFVESEPHITMTTAMTQKPNLTDQHTTLAPIESVSAKSTTPFLLTPYTTLYFDTSHVDINSSSEENKSTTPFPKKTRGRKRKRKKLKEKNDTSRSKKYEIKEEGTPFISSPFTTPMPEFQIDFNVSENSNFPHSTTPFSEKLLLTTKYEFKVASDEPISEINLNKSDTCAYSQNDPLSSLYVITTTPSYMSLDARRHEEKWLTISSDKKVASGSDAANTTDRCRDNRYLSRFDDNVVSSNKSSLCHNKSVDSPLFPREEAILPSLDEEFSTDVLPDFDDNLLLNFGVSTSTVSLPSLISIDEAWINSNVIDSSKSLVYPDELEQYYIMVP